MDLILVTGNMYGSWLNGSTWTTYEGYQWRFQKVQGKCAISEEGRFSRGIIFI